jgi:hypothetical protein
MGTAAPRQPPRRADPSAQSHRPPPAGHRGRALLLHIQGAVHVMSRDTPQLGLAQPLRGERNER